MRLRHAVTAALALAILPAPARAAQLDFCGPVDRACTRLAVPLDHTGRFPGKVTLHLERMRAKAATDPPLFLLAGGPGQSATRAFPRLAVREILGPVLRRRDLVVLDQRGTGSSGVLSCPALQRAGSLDAVAPAEDCATSLGSGRAFYTTRDSVADIDAVRHALGYERIALLGVSYGTKVALAYAEAHPDRVDRLVLDSAVELDGPDPLYRASFAATPRVLRELCRSRCGGITQDAVRDLNRLLRRLRRGPLRGTVVTPRGRRRRASLTRFDLFSMLVAGDLRQSVRARFPAAVRSAIRGDRAPIFRLERLARTAEDVGPQERAVSAATYAATICEESVLPWDRTAAQDQRRVQARVRAEAASPAAFAPFDVETALASDVLRLCERWPAQLRAPALGAGPPSGVPVLVLGGSQDLRTPVEDAGRVAGLFARGLMLRVPLAGHSVIGSGSSCATSAVRRFLSGRRVPRSCPPEALPRPSSLAPASLRDVRPARRTSGRAGRTFAAVRLTYQDALAQFFDYVLESDPSRIGAVRFRGGGLRAGSYAFRRDRARLRGVVYVPGVRVSGRLTSVSILPDGLLHVRGRAAARGTLRVRNGILSGRLGGRRVRGALGPDLFDLSLDLLLPELLGARLARLTPR